MTVTQSAARLAATIADLQRRIEHLERHDQLSGSSVEGSNLPIYDDSGVLRQTVGLQPDGTYTTVDSNGNPPPAPSQPYIDASQPGVLIVSWDGQTSALTTDWPLDWDHVEVHVDVVDGFVPSDATQVATFASLKGGSVTLALPSSVHYVKFQAVSTSGVESAASAQASGTPTAPATGAGGVKTYAVAADSTGNGPTGLTASDDGAIWYDTGNGNHPYRWNGSTLAWVSMQDATGPNAQTAANNAQAAANNAQSTADSKSRTWTVSTWASRPALTANDDGDLLFVTDQPDHQWLWNGTSLAWESAIAPYQAPPATDGAAPASSPNLDLTGGVGVLLARWTPISNADPVAYELHVSTTQGFTPAAATLYVTTAGSTATIKNLPDGTALAYGPEDTPTVYYAKLVAKDPDGAAPAGTEASASLRRVTTDDVSAAFVYAGHVVADQIESGTLDATVSVAGTFETGPVGGQRAVMDAEGIHLSDSSGNPIVDLPTTGQASFSGVVSADTLTVNNLTTLVESEVAENATLTLQGSIQSPTNPPTPSYDYPYVQYTNDGNWGLDRRGWSSDGTYRYTVNRKTLQLEKWNPSTGQLVASSAKFGSDVNRFHAVYGGGYVWMLYWQVISGNTNGGSWYLNRYDTNLAYQAHYADLTGLVWDSTWRDAALGYDPATDHLLFAHARQSDGFAYFRSASWNKTTLTDTTLTKVDDVTSDTGLPWQFSTILRGTFDQGADNWIVGDAQNNDNWRNWAAATAAPVTQYDWPAGFAETRSGMFWDTSASVFRAVTGSGKEYTYQGGGNTWTDTAASKTFDVAYTWANASSNAETTRSPLASQSLPKRARLRIGVPVLPHGVDTVKFYARATATDKTTLGNTRYQGSSTTQSIIISNLNLTGTTYDPTTNTFGSGTPAKVDGAVLRQDGNPKVRLRGDGSGNFDGLIPPGTVQMYAGTTEPAGWKFCNGQSLSRSVNADLYAVIGTTFGAGSDTTGGTTFSVPNFTGKFPRGGTPGGTGGADTVTIGTANLPAHSHPAGSLGADSAGSHQHPLWRNTGGAGGSIAAIPEGINTPIGPWTNSGDAAGAHTHTVSGSTGNTGSGSALTVTNPYTALNFIIKV